LFFAGIVGLMLVARPGRAEEKAVETPPASQADAANIQNSQPKSEQQQPATEQKEPQDTQSDQPLDLNAPSNGDHAHKQPAQPKSAESSRNRKGASLGVNITPSGRGEGLVVTRVAPGTPADQMGIRSGDRITLINGQAVGPVDEFIATIRSMNSDDQVELQIVRDGIEQAFRGQLERFGRAVARSPQLSSNDEYQIYRSVVGGQDPNQFRTDNSRDAQRSPELSANRQASFEDRPTSNGQPPSDLDARLRRIEEHLDRLSQDVEQLRNLVGTPAVSSGLREAASDELRANGPQTQRRAPQITPQPSAAALKRDDRWDTENRFDQADLAGARERAAAEAARRQANQLGARLQQQQRNQAANAKQSTSPTSNSEVPPQPTTDQSPPSTEQPK
jgi:hypothetical protein